jgi:hypothetical protein
VFFEPSKRPAWQIFGAYGLNYILTSAAYLIWNIPVVTMICSIVTDLLILLLYEGTLRRYLAAIAFIWAFQFSTESLVYVCILQSPLKMTTYGTYAPVLSHVILTLVNYMTAVLVNQLKSIRKQLLPGIFQVVSSLIVSGISFYFAFVILTTDNFSKTTCILCIAGVLTINVLMVTLYDSLAASYVRNMELALGEQEKAYYQHQCELMMTAQNEITAFRHDIRNHLTVLSDIAKHHNDEETLNYIDDLIKETHFRGNYSKSGNLPIDSIINYKLRTAEEQNIAVTVEVAVPEQLTIETADIVTVLGNLLDNALDALQKTEKRELLLKAIYTKGRLMLTVRNSYNGDVHYQNGNILTTKGTGHGYGLHNIQNTLNKYNGALRIDYNLTYFTVNIMLYVPENTMQN